MTLKPVRSSLKRAMWSAPPTDGVLRRPHKSIWTRSPGWTDHSCVVSTKNGVRCCFPKAHLGQNILSLLVIESPSTSSWAAIICMVPWLAWESLRCKISSDCLSLSYGRSMNRMSSQCPTSFRRWGNGFKKWPIHAITHNFSHYDLPVVKKMTPICHMKREDGFLCNNIGWEQIPPKIRNVYDVLQDAQSVTTFSLDLDVDIATANKKQHRSSNPFYKMTFVRDIFVGSKVLSIINHVISTSTIDVPVCCVQKSMWIICHECPESSKARWTGWVSIMILLRCKMLALIFFWGVALPSPMSKATASPTHNSLLSIVNLLPACRSLLQTVLRRIVGFLAFRRGKISWWGGNARVGTSLV